MKQRGANRAFIITGSAILALTIVWQLTATLGERSRWGTPGSVFRTIVDWLLTGAIWPHLLSTVGIALAGLFIGGIFGLLLASACWVYPSFAAVGVPIMGLVNSLPRILLVPIFIAFLGIGLVAKLTMVVTMTVFIFFFNTYTGLANIDPRLIANARLMGANRVQTIEAVYIPLVFEWVTAGMRSAVGLAFIGAVIAEYFGSTSGLGYIVDLSYGMNRYDQAVAGLILIFLTVGIIDWGIRRLEQRWLAMSQ